MSEGGLSQETIEQPRVEQHKHLPPIIDLREQQYGLLLGSSIRVAADTLAYDQWETLLKATEATQQEHGIVLADDGHRLIASKVFKGEGVRNDFESDTTSSPSIKIPPFIHGIRNIFRLKDRVLIHTHPMGDLPQLPTTVLSDSDIASYYQSNYNALIAIDKGGVHMVAGRSHYPSSNEPDIMKLYDDAYKKSLKETKTVAQARSEIGKAIAPLGMKYYFAPHETSSNGFITFEDAATYKSPQVIT